MKLIIEGDITRKDLINLGKFLVKNWRGRPEHINVLILDGLEGKSIAETSEILKEMFKQE